MAGGVAYDPCLSCAVHVMRPDEQVKILARGHYHSEEKMHPHGHGHGRRHRHDTKPPQAS